MFNYNLLQRQGFKCPGVFMIVHRRVTKLIQWWKTYGRIRWVKFCEGWNWM